MKTKESKKEMEDRCSPMARNEEPNAIPIRYFGIPASLRTSWSNGNVEEDSLGAKLMGISFAIPVAL